MAMEQRHSAEQKQVLTQQLRQSLQILQFSVPELREYINEQALANPLIELETPPLSEATPGDWFTEVFSPTAGTAAYASGDASGEDRPAWEPAAETSLSDQLHRQAALTPGLEGRTRALCDYLIDCLSENGYLELPLEELSAELYVDLFSLEQALYALQSLDPPGVGARSLRECLILQLERGKDFNADTIAIADRFLPLLARNDIAAIARELRCGRERAQAAADAIRRLNPSPFYGCGDSFAPLQIPEGEVITRDGRLVLEWNQAARPGIHYSRETERILRQNGTDAELAYLREKQGEFHQLQDCLRAREETVTRLVRLLLEHQRDFLLRGGPLRPLTMNQLADELGVHVSTVSRAVRGKSVLHQGRTLLLRDLFSVPVDPAEGMSADFIQRKICAFIGAEDPAHPLSDEKLRGLLEAAGICLSRRSVSNYREAAGIPAAPGRRKRTG